MDAVVPDFEELMLCGYCKQKFNDTDQSPKLLSCKHYFCLQCMRTNLTKGRELYCIYCWKRTEVSERGPDALPTYNPVLCLTKNFSQLKVGVDKPPVKVVSENCHTHAMPLALWCHTCSAPVCRACATTSDHVAHQIKAKDHLVAEMQLDLSAMNKTLGDVQRLAVQQREFLLKILEACVTLKTHVEAELTNNVAHFELSDTRDALAKLQLHLSMADNLSEVCNLHASVDAEKHRLQLRHQEMYSQCQLDELVRTSGVLFDFQLLRQSMSHVQNGEPPPMQPPHAAPPNPILFLANYCMTQLFSRHLVAKQQTAPSHKPPPKNIYQENNLVPEQLLRRLLYYFNVEVNGVPSGRVVIEVRADVAPKMAKNFGVLATGEAGVGYKGCQVFQCWEGESVITGDFELNNGRGGRSVFEEGFFLPDDTKLMAVRGSVGMRRTQKRHDNLGMVGSQFRIILQEMRGFTGIFGHVVEGLELVEKISTYGDTAGKPTKNIVISKCGKL